MMERKEKDGVHWLEFEIFAEVPNLRHAIFLRHGGHSHQSFDSLNFSYTTEDDPKNVDANVSKVKKILGIEHLVRPSLHHGKTITAVGIQHVDERPLCDGLCTQALNLGLLTTHADCQTAIFYDPIHHAVANVHSGWRGNVQNIYAETTRFMQQCYQTNPADILVGISPSLGPQAAEFINYRTEFPEEFWKFETKSHYFDLWEIAKEQLTESGVLPSHLEIAKICTYSNPQDFFSYRREKRSGRHGTIVYLK